MSKSMIKTTLICFSDVKIVIHFESVPKGTSADQTFYLQVLKGLSVALCHTDGRFSRILPRCADTFFASNVAIFTREKKKASLQQTIHRTLLTWLRPILAVSETQKNVLKGTHFLRAVNVKSPVRKF
jgi:hypothetical protein